MANALSTAYRSQGIKVTGWLFLAILTGALTIVVWIASAVKPAASQKKTAVETPTVPDPLIKLSTTNPNEMATAVKPITFDAVVRDMRNYPPQFTDSRFLKSNAGKWTIQIMNVAEHEVVTDYLNGREDKDNFKYFRIVDENNQKRYVVTYGLYGSAGEAETASKTVDFGLPSNVKAFSEEVRSYLAQVDEYEVTPPVSDLGAKTPKEVKLHSTPKVIPAPKAKSKDEDKSATATDTASDAKNASDVPDTSDTKASTDTKNATDTPPNTGKSDDTNATNKPTAQPAQTVAKPTTPKPSAVPTRPAPRGETLVIQDKPVPAFVEKPATHKADNTQAKQNSLKQEAKKPTEKSTATVDKPKKTDSQKSDTAN